MKKPWSVPWQSELDFMDEAYAANYPPLDLEPYKNDRNLEFYRLQNELLLNYQKTKKIDSQILWKMYPFVEGVVSSIAKKKVCTGCHVPHFNDKVQDTVLIVLQHYQDFPYYRAEKLENVVYHKVTEVFLDKNLQINERTASFDMILERRQNREEAQDSLFEKSSGFYGDEDEGI